MKKLLLVASLVFSMLSGPSALAGHDTFTEPGTIELPNPATAVTGGVTEIFGLCDPDSDFQDLDGHWFGLPAGFGDGTHAAELSPGEDTTDVDAYFYDADCNFIDDLSLAQQPLGVDESGTIPAGTAYIIVDLFASVGPGSFTLSG